jgi:hypothetical protein
VKDAVDAGKTVNFVVTANYGRSPINTSAARAAGETLKAEIAEAEQHVPLSVTCHAHEVDASGNTGAVIATPPPVPNDIGTEAPENYQLAPGVASIDVNAEFTALSSEATGALAATPTLTWTAFRGAGRNGRIDRLEAADAARVTTLRNIFRDHHLARLFANEQGAIAALGELRTWADFTRGRTAYDSSRPEDERLSDSQISTLQTAFNGRRDTLREQRTGALVGLAGGLTARENWGDFRRRERVIESEGGLTDSQVSRVRAAFDARMAALPALTSPTVG